MLDPLLASLMFAQHCRTILCSSIIYSRRLTEELVVSEWLSLCNEAQAMLTEVVESVHGNRKKNPDGTVTMPPESVRLVYTATLKKALEMMEGTP